MDIVTVTVTDMNTVIINQKNDMSRKFTDEAEFLIHLSNSPRHPKHTRLNHDFVLNQMNKMIKNYNHENKER